MKIFQKSLSTGIFLKFVEHFLEPLVVFESETFDILYANQNAYNLFGEQLDLSRVFEKNEYMNFINLIKDCQGLEYSGTINFIKPDGARGLLSFDIFPILYEDDRVTFCRFRDITEELTKKGDIKENKAQLIFKNKVRAFNLITSSVAHEINNICNVMLNNLQLTYNAWQDIFSIIKEYEEEYGEFMIGGISSQEFDKIMPRLILAVSDGANRIRETFEEFKKHVQNGVTSENTMVDINEVVRRVVLILSHTIFLHTENFSMQLQDNLPKINGNVQKLEQVVINLLMNALQSLPDRKKAVSILTSFQSDKKRIYLEIKDEGRGISEEDMHHIYKPFFSTKHASGGTGLGLYLSRAIVEEHNGDIIIESEKAVGTQVKVYLPV